MNEFGVSPVGYKQNVFFGYNALNAVVTHLQQCASGSKEVDELFGQVGAAVWPKAASNASAHYHAISIVHV